MVLVPLNGTARKGTTTMTASMSGSGIGEATSRWARIHRVGVLALARIAVGVLDFSTATEVTGTVVSVRDRQTLDFLPHSALQTLYRRNPHRIDARKRRTELALHTDAGTRQWTVHKSGLVRELRRSDTVRLTVTPLAGHVSRVTPVPR